MSLGDYSQGSVWFEMGVMNFDWEKLCEVASTEVEGVLNELPEALRERVQELPITFEHKPGEELQADGIEEDALGVFVGAEFAEGGDVPMPSQIILFLENIWDQAEGDENAFPGEIQTTFLHELGHFLGLDEDDLMERGLD
ncbi:MAG TPA: metallopeptidase family protein [Candidatus Sulfotelmatobacter sp.]|nr:metallopeptidase family protein [Candidatus Sulfotelmatobacter sp.]